MATLIRERPIVVVEKVGKEILYGFISFLIVFIFKAIMGTIEEAEGYGWAIPIVDAFLHGIMKSFKQFDLALADKYSPIYTKIIKFGKIAYDKIKLKFKKETPALIDNK